MNGFQWASVDGLVMNDFEKYYCWLHCSVLIGLGKHCF